MLMATTWIVAADASRARILQVADRDRRLEELEDLLNPEGRLKDGELAADARGRWSGPDRPGGNAMHEEVSPSEHVAEVFAKRIGDYLEKARTEHRYEQLYLVAPPKFLGVLRRKLDRDVEKLVVQELPKDLSGLRIQDLQEQLAELVQGNVRAP
jgi:protein required for attachment to host cells